MSLLLDALRLAEENKKQAEDKDVKLEELPSSDEVLTLDELPDSDIDLSSNPDDIFTFEDIPSSEIEPEIDGDFLREELESEAVHSEFKAEENQTETLIISEELEALDDMPLEGDSVEIEPEKTPEFSTTVESAPDHESSQAATAQHQTPSPDNAAGGNMSPNQEAQSEKETFIRQPGAALSPALNIFAAGSDTSKPSSGKGKALLLLLLIAITAGVALWLYWDSQQEINSDLTADLILEEELITGELSDGEELEAKSLDSSVQNNQGGQVPSLQAAVTDHLKQPIPSSKTGQPREAQNKIENFVDQPNELDSEALISAAKPKPSAVIKIERRTLSSSLSANLEGAYKALLVGKYDEAKISYLGILDQHPKQIDALLGLAKIFSHEKNSVEARALYETVLRADDANTIAQLGLLHTYQGESSFNKLNILQELTKKFPESPQIAAALGHELVERSKWVEAQKAYFQAFSLAPTSAPFAYNLAVSLDQMGKYSSAINFYKKALILNEEYASTLDAVSVNTRLRQLEGEDE